MLSVEFLSCEYLCIWFRYCKPRSGSGKGGRDRKKCRGGTQIGEGVAGTGTGVSMNRFEGVIVITEPDS